MSDSQTSSHTHNARNDLSQGRGPTPRPLHVRTIWEHTHREALASLILAHRLKRRGGEGELRQLRFAHLDPATPSTLCFPFFYDDLDIERYFATYSTTRQVLINLSYEQMHFRCGRGYILPDGALARTQMFHCAWGPKYKNYLLDHGIPEERITITGHPRFDIYHTPSLLYSREHLAGAYGLDPKKPWILIPYNFNLSYITPQLVKSLQARRYTLTQPFIDGVTRARDAFTRLNDHLCTALPHAEIILRVHPAGFESEEIYRGLSQEHDNLHLIGAWDIAHWIKQACAVMVWNSTSAMEAMVAGVPVFSYEPHPFSAPFEYDLNTILPTMTHIDDVTGALEALSLGRSLDLSYDWPLFEEWYAHRDGRNADRLIEMIERLHERFDEVACDWSGVVSPWVRLKSKWSAFKRARKGASLFAQIGESTLEETISTLDVRALEEALR